MAKFVLCIVMFASVVVAHRCHPKFPKNEEYSNPLTGLKGEYRKGEYDGLPKELIRRQRAVTMMQFLSYLNDSVDFGTVSLIFMAPNISLNVI